MTTTTGESNNNNSNDNANNTTVLLKVAVGSTNPCKVQAVEMALKRIMGIKQQQPQQNQHHCNYELQVQGFDVPSGVSHQPFGDKETKKGAKRRARNAYRAYRNVYGSFPHLAIGLEGGLEWSSQNNNNDDDDDSDDEEQQELDDTTADEKKQDPPELDNEEKKENSEKGNVLVCMAWMAVYGKRTALLSECLASDDIKFYIADKSPQYGLAKTACFALPEEIANLVKSGMELGDADDQLFGRTNSKHGSGTVGILTHYAIDRSQYYEHAIILALVPWIRPDVYNTNNDEKKQKEQEEASTSTFRQLFCLLK